MPEPRERTYRATRCLGAVVLSIAALPAAAPAATLSGRVLSAGRALRATRISLFATATGAGQPTRLAVGATSRAGAFTIRFAQPRGPGRILYVLAGPDGASRLAAVVGAARSRNHVVVNERTTVAMAFGLAQFIVGKGAVRGTLPGIPNAAGMAANLAGARTGRLGTVLATRPNGAQTSTLRTFNSLANLIVPCAGSGRCTPLFRAARDPRGPTPTSTLVALADVARNPWHNAARLFALTRAGGQPYTPALSPAQRPTAWTLALRFDGDGATLNGPGNMAIDARGNIWVTGNYTYSRNPLAPVCGSPYVFKFTPTGRYASGSPFSGGGLSGAGFGITLDPHGNVWVGNFGFASTSCPSPPPHNSVSEFTSTGRALSPNRTLAHPGGYTIGGISWPQGTVSDRTGNIWIANCGNNSVTRYAGGNPRSFTQLSNLGITKPFDIAFNGRGQAYVTGNGSSGVAILQPNGTPAPGSPITSGGIDKPLGIAADTHGNMWVSNSRLLDVPCPGMTVVPPTQRGSITLITSTGHVARPAPFTGGGLVLPWGVAVDGHNNVWVANFGHQRLSEFCGVDATACPPGDRTGSPISPSSGYAFDGLTRNTGVQIDPSGNAWVANNWKNKPVPDANPGGYEIVAFVGVAGPVRTPLIGPPRTP